ncbi:hypothetical protein [Roseomonas harenae]|uniref:hypothetical protein n=1 Tax=Muricoccus harenae TaxID=2692566 RepID=UPI001331726C|nr:hypothetical protein [Roseomonas harenae]
MPIIFFLIAAALAIPTYGISLVVWLAFRLFSSTGKQVDNIERVIRELTLRNISDYRAFAGISYVIAKNYATTSPSEVLIEVGDYFSFRTPIEGVSYLVEVNKNPEGSGVILRSKLA